MTAQNGGKIKKIFIIFNRYEYTLEMFICLALCYVYMYCFLINNCKKQKKTTKCTVRDKHLIGKYGFNILYNIQHDVGMMRIRLKKNC